MQFVGLNNCRVDRAQIAGGCGVTLVVSEYGEMFAWGCADDGALKLDSGEHSQLPSFVLPGSLSAQPRKEPVQGVRGAGICQHQRERSQYKECGGASICPHQRRRSRCKGCLAKTDE